MAKLMLSRDVLKDFGRLPIRVQKKVFEFVRKFQDDSTQAPFTWNLSPKPSTPRSAARASATITGRSSSRRNRATTSC